MEQLKKELANLPSRVKDKVDVLLDVAKTFRKDELPSAKKAIEALISFRERHPEEPPHVSKRESDPGLQ